MTPVDLDQPDDLLGHQDPFVHAVRIWTSLHALRRQGLSGRRMYDMVRNMDEVLIRHRKNLMEQYTLTPPVFRTQELLRRLGLEYWADGNLLDTDASPTDPHRRTP